MELQVISKKEIIPTFDKQAIKLRHITYFDTEGLALMSLAHIYPDESEKYAIDFWDRKKFQNDEYQKIMVLHVLHTIQSSQLEHYLNLAEHSKYNWLRENAKEIRWKMRGGNLYE